MVITIAIILVFFGILCNICRHVSPHTRHHHTQNCTTLQPSISTHTHKYTHQQTPKKKHTHIPTKTIHIMQFRMLVATVLLYVNCLSYPILYYLTGPCVIFACLCLCILYFWYWMYICIYIYKYCCFRYLNGVCPIRDDHCGHHQNTHTRFLIVQALWWRTTTSSSSPVPELLYCFFLWQGIASGCLSIILLVLPIAVLLLLLLVLLLVLLLTRPTNQPITRLVIHNLLLLLLRGKGRVLIRQTLWKKTNTSTYSKKNSTHTHTHTHRERERNKNNSN